MRRSVSSSWALIDPSCLDGLELLFEGISVGHGAVSSRLSIGGPCAPIILAAPTSRRMIGTWEVPVDNGGDNRTLAPALIRDDEKPVHAAVPIIC